MDMSVPTLSVPVCALSARARTLCLPGKEIGEGELGMDEVGTVPALALLCGCLGGIGIPLPLILSGLGAFDDCGYGESDDSRFPVECVDCECRVDRDWVDLEGVERVWLECGVDI